MKITMILCRQGHTIDTHVYGEEHAIYSYI